MGFGSIWHWIIVLVIVLLLFGAGKIPRLMGDMAKGVKAFKAGLKDEAEGASGSGSGDAAQPAQPKPIDNAAATPAASAVEKDHAAKP
ncbi:MAG: twin-arginine translocase TatA/TatE family subunit [Rhodospirillales bacterium]|nr:twin-arginine translocase TatA/TatE family subunit [Rhodospirillales bacterium]